jgi:hypothetical protein
MTIPAEPRSAPWTSARIGVEHARGSRPNLEASVLAFLLRFFGAPVETGEVS